MEAKVNEIYKALAGTNQQLGSMRNDLMDVLSACYKELVRARLSDDNAAIDELSMLHEKIKSSLAVLQAAQLILGA